MYRTDEYAIQRNRKTSLIQVRIEETLKSEWKERLKREGRNESATIRDFIRSYLESPEATKEPIRVTLVNSHPLLQPRISGKKEVFNLALGNAKELLLKHGFVTKELKHKIVAALKGISITPDEKADLDTVMKAPEARK